MRIQAIILQNIIPRGENMSGKQDIHELLLIVEKLLDLILEQYYRMLQEQKGMQARGKNIKVYDKIKIKHASTDYRLHAQERELKYGSYNQAVGCHKSIDQTDWFVVLKADNNQPQNFALSYHFQYGDKILLSNSMAKKYLHANSEFQSEISKNYQVCLCDNGDGSPSCYEDEWIIIKASNTQDNYWRVGEQINLESATLHNLLCSHRRKMKQTGDNQVFVLNPSKNLEQKTDKDEKAKASNLQINKDSVWIVSEIEPFIYSSNLTQKKTVKISQQTEEINRLKQMKKQIKKREKSSASETAELLKFGNERIRQIEDERKKIQEEQKKKSCWRRYFCCCCPADNDYVSLN